MKHQFNISYKNTGPFDLKNTIYSGQTSQPPWLEIHNNFKELVLIENTPCIIKIHHEDSNPYSNMNIIAQCRDNIPKNSIKSKIREIFSLNHDMNRLYGFLESDSQLAPTVEFCRGLRLFNAHDPFECIISSISSANCSILRWTRSIKDIKQKWGEKYSIDNGVFHLFPSPNIISKLPESDLEEMQRCEDNLPEGFQFNNNLQACGVGYRAKYIIQAAEMIENEISMEKLAKRKYEDAFEIILELPGVGPKVADCILLYGFGMTEAFPVDVWIKRIICHLYFDGKDVSVPKIREFGMERFGEYAGYTQLYLFHYARKSGLLDKLTPEKK
ncbi:DNA glycosylase [Methanobacterium alcaliphilum]|uniref:DNA glycosylase n=1 Tax=Methanobacterium alcaliphilum TaxID=392018 RepID=UPI00200A6F85|nr:DNA glycosylase [Methanobacterium alcaliphilum]MCK9151041.1 DNA lyase [Methanobacterium alcaliphilum]